MADIYEFHVSGIVGPVVRSALPELSAAPGSRNSVLSGRANCADDIDRVLHRLGEAGLTASHIVITREQRWRQLTGCTPDCSGGSVPVVNDHGPEHHVLD